MKKFIQFFRKIRAVKNIYLKILLVFSSSLAFGQTITPTKTVVQNVNSCGIIDVELKVIGANPIARPLEVILVIDRSGSMTSGSPETSMDHAKDAAIDFINNIFLPANNPTGLNKVAIVSYATTATINQVLTASSGKAGLISVVNALNANGSTNIQDGIVKADNELTAHGSFNCNTSRSIILLTDGVANVTGPSGSSCSGGTGGTCIQSAITAATNAKTTTVSSVVYNNQIFSVGLFGGISGTDQTNATYCLNNIQSGGAFFTESAANLTGIYAQILNQISWVAAQIPGTSFNKETVNNNFNIVAGSISVSKGTFVQTGQVIDWNIDFLNSETITLKYRLTPKPNICGDNIVSTSRLDYLNSSCLATFQNVTTPNYCVPCAPILSGLPSQTTINCPTIPNFITPTVTNGCLSTSLTFVDVTTPSTACPLKYSITRTWTASNSCYSATVSQTINVQDVTAPVIAPLPAISTINCTDIPSFATATATDACGGPVTLTFADVTTASTACPLKYSITRTWTAKDNCNNTSTASQTINVQDVTAPFIATLPAISTINCPDIPSFATATATDACGGPVTLTFVDVTTPSTACPLKYSITRTWTAKDNCNNTSTASQTINVQDVTAPVIATLPAISTINCPDVPSFATATATDACGGPVTLTFTDVTLTFTDVTTASTACPLKYSITRTWTAKDNCNNTSTASQTINVQDVTAPVIAPLPAISTINCPDVPSFATATATDACGGPVTLTFADVTTASTACPLKYSITRTWTAKDNCNNTSTASQTINVQDVTAPVIAPLPAISTINCPSVPSFATATATDACGGPVTLTFADVTTASTACPLKYSITRTWTAKDNCNNTSTASQTINVQDVTAPVIATLPAISTINCPDVPSFATATATDACGGPVTLTFADVTTASTACPLKYSITRTWTAKDNCNNTSTASQTINVQDVTAPVIAPLPAISIINCPDIPSFATATATDACGGPVTLTFADVTTPSTACPLKYSITRTWTAKDNCNNTSIASQTINVQDVTAPVIAPLPAISTINCPDVPSFATATATDACGGPVTLTFADVTTPSSACPLKYSITRTWTAKDNCNNTSTASQTINVQDVTAPVIAPLPAISTINCPAVPNFATATATDACGGTVTLTFEDVTTASTTCPLKYSITRTWTAKDNCNNTSIASQTINVQDVTAPVIAPLPAISTINCPAVPSFATATATDACGGPVTLTFEDVTTASTACPLKYSITRTWTAKDNCNNTSTASQTINVQDVTAPVIAPLPAISTINCPAVPNFATATATDACGGTVTLTFEDVTTASTTCPLKYSITRTWTAKDNCNNTSIASQTINVQDVTAPVIAPLPAISTINCPAVPSFATATATDACGGTVTLTFEDVTTASTACPLKYSITRTWTAKDNCNNTSTASQTINVQDVTAPVIAPLPAISTINCPAVPSFATATATDACGGTVTLTFEDVTTASTACPLKYSITRTWTAKDNCNNTSTASQTINVQDVTAPVITIQVISQTVECDGAGNLTQLNAWLASNGGASASDVCSGVTWTNNYSGSLSDLCGLTGTATVTFTATDACGNYSSSTGTFTIFDSIKPIIETNANSITLECDGQGNVEALANWIASNGGAFASDNCSSVTWSNDYSGSLSDLCGLTGSATVTFTATDACGNYSSSTGTFTIQDTTNPNLTTEAASQTVECDGAGNLTQLNAWLASNGGASASDVCSGVTWTNNYSGSLSDLCGLTGTATVTFTATDACGNFSSSTGTFTIFDSIKPVIETNANSITLECDGQGNVEALANWITSNGGAFASDNCSSVTWSNDYSGSLSDLCGLTGSATVTFTATDACGNYSSSTGTFTIQDTTAPVFTSELPGNISVSCDAIPIPQELTGVDSCSSEITITSNDDIVENESNCIGEFTILRTWTITDSCGNNQSYTQTISIFDTTAPTLVSPLSTQVDAICSEIPPKPNLEFTDNCSGVNPNIVYTETTTTISIYQYVIVRDWTVSDNCGNQANFSQTINVSVNEPFDAIPYRICLNETINLFTLLPDDLPTNGTWLEVNTNGAITGSVFNPSNLAFGYYTIRYIVNVENNPCPFIYEIYINVANCDVLAACDITVYNAVSPNGDGKNEIFLIDGITCYPNNTVEIYNRWGVNVYKANGYNNNNIYFDGLSQNKLTVGDDKLPGDTYFYILKYSDAQNNSFEKTGYLYIKY